jgi:hypothetical protein
MTLKMQMVKTASESRLGTQSAYENIVTSPLPTKAHTELNSPLIDSVPASISNPERLHERTAINTVGRIGMMRCVCSVKHLGSKL